MAYLCQSPIKIKNALFKPLKNNWLNDSSSIHNYNFYTNTGGKTTEVIFLLSMTLLMN